MDHSVEGYINRQTTQQLRQMLEITRNEKRESFDYIASYILQVIAQREKIEQK